MPKYYGEVQDPHSQMPDYSGSSLQMIYQGPHVLLGFLPKETVPIVLDRHRHVNEVAQDITINLGDGCRLIMTGVWTTPSRRLRDDEDGHRVYECYVTRQRDCHG